VTVIVCVQCGAVGSETDEIPLGWTIDRDGSHVTLLCAQCTRDVVRSIEGKLDREWW
jgi:hypothetical protein